MNLLAVDPSTCQVFDDGCLGYIFPVHLVRNQNNKAEILPIFQPKNNIFIVEVIML